MTVTQASSGLAMALGLPWASVTSALTPLFESEVAAPSPTTRHFAPVVVAAALPTDLLSFLEHTNDISVASRRIVKVGIGSHYGSGASIASATVRSSATLLGLAI